MLHNLIGEREVDLANAIAGKIEVGTNFGRRRVAIPLWYSTGQAGSVCPAGLFEMHATRHQRSGMVARLVLRDGIFTYISEQGKVLISDERESCVAHPLNRFPLRQRWRIHEDGGRSWMIRRIRSGVVEIVAEGTVGEYSRIEMFKCRITHEDARRPERFWHKYSGCLDFELNDRFISPNAAELFMEAVTGFSIVATNATELFQFKPPIVSPLVVSEVQGIALGSLPTPVVAGCIFCCSWCL